MTTGISPTTGAHVSGLDYLKIRIADILSTRIGTRLMRYEYGSELPALIDTAINRTQLIEVYAATADALDRWEDEFRLQNVVVDSVNPGQLTVTLTGIYLPSGVSVTLEGINVA